MSISLTNDSNSFWSSIWGTGISILLIFDFETSRKVVPEPSEFKYSVLFFSNIYKNTGLTSLEHSKFLKPWLHAIGLPTIPTLPIGARVDNKTVLMGIRSNDFDFLPISVIFLTVSYT